MPDSLKHSSIDDIVAALQPYLAVILASFGPGRIIFGSDWPVCTIGMGGKGDGEGRWEGDGEGIGAWEKWRRVVERFVDVAGLSEEDKIMIWSGTAIRAYAIKELM